MSKCAAMLCAVWAVCVLAGALNAAATGSQPASSPAASKPASRPASGPAVAPAQIAAAIRQLSADALEDREAAMKSLLRMGKQAKSALEQAAAGDDPEKASRAADVLASIKYGIGPDTPEEVKAAVEAYRTQEADDKQASLAALFDLKAYDVLAAISQADKSPASKDMFRPLLERDANTVPGLLALGDFEHAQAIWELGARCGFEQAIRDWAACLLARGQLDEKIRSLADATEPWQRRLLAYLHRAKGNLPAAVEAASKAQDPDLVAKLKFELGDWKFLAQAAELPICESNSIRDWATVACYQRLAGDAAACEATMKHVLEMDSNGDTKAVIDMLFVNDRPDMAIEYMVKKGERMRACKFLQVLGRYDEALDLLGPPVDDLAVLANATDSAQQESAQADRIRIAVATGQDDLAKAGWARLRKRWDAHLQALIDEVKNLPDHKPQPQPSDAVNRCRGTMMTTIQLEDELGLRDEAWRDTARAVAELTPLRPQNENYVCFFAWAAQEREQEIAAWWAFLQTQPTTAATRPVDDRAGRLREVLDGKTPPKTLAEMAKLACEQAGGDGAARANTATQIAQTCRRYGLNDLANELTSPWQKHDIQADALPQTDPVAVFNQGLELAKSGKADEAKRLYELADLLAMAREDKRWMLRNAIEKHELPDMAGRQNDIELWVGDFTSVHVANMLGHLRYQMNAKKEYDYRAAALYAERQRIAMLKLSAYFYIHPTAELETIWCSHWPQALMHLAAGDAKAAAAEVEICQRAYPLSMKCVIPIVPSLDRLGAKAEANAVFDRTWAANERLCSKHPMVNQMNEMAWGAARCRHNLPQAEAYARKAMVLAKDDARLMDTLAELRFQQNDRAGALEIIRRAIDTEARTRGKDPDKKIGEYLQRQLKRFETLEPSSDPQE